MDLKLVAPPPLPPKYYVMHVLHTHGICALNGYIGLTGPLRNYDEAAVVVAALQARYGTADHHGYRVVCAKEPWEVDGPFYATKETKYAATPEQCRGPMTLTELLALCAADPSFIPVAPPTSAQ